MVSDSHTQEVVGLGARYPVLPALSPELTPDIWERTWLWPLDPAEWPDSPLESLCRFQHEVKREL